MTLNEILLSKIVLGDGANGTLLAEKGFHGPNYELANIQAPDLIKTVHTEYIQAGVDFITTNTFKANRYRMADSNADLYKINVEGAKIAKQAITYEQFVFGSIGPCGKPIAPIGTVSLKDVYCSTREQAEALIEGGVDAFLLETYIDLEELKTAVEAIQSISNLPIIASKAFIEDGEALNEGLPFRCAEEMSKIGLAAIGANCVVGPQRMLDIIRQMVEATDLPVLAFPTPGLPLLVRGEITYDTSPEYFAKATARLAEEGARIIGGCCGTSVKHISGIRKILDSKTIKVKERSEIKKQSITQKELESSEQTELAHKLGKKFIVTVELDLPRGLNVQKVIKGAKSLKIKGADLIDISDGARARLRMNPLPISSLIQNQAGIEVMMHFSCRDRNLLAIQADLLGAHALGVRNILAITGDPANIGDYPSATSVFDVDAVGLTRILSRFNEGVDLAGYSVGVKCAFTIAVAFNPLAQDMSFEIDRLKRKLDAGAHLAYTQPLFEEKALDITVNECAKLDLPVFVGVLPLRHTRHAEFMHNEVPGIEVPEWLRKKIRDAQDDSSAKKIGIHEAQLLSEQVSRSAQGLYLMPPFGSHQVAEEVMEAVL